MPYTTTELITRSYNLSSVVSRDLETVTGDQLNEGLDLLNELLSIKSANQRLIPYFGTYEFTAVIGHEEYFIPNLILAESLTFSLDNVRYSMLIKSRREYFSTPRANNTQSLPYQWHYEREFGGAKLWMYFLPDREYPFELWGKFSLQDVSLNQDLSLTISKFYLAYLRYALAEYICQEYNINFPEDNQRELDSIEQKLIDISPIDLTTFKMSSLQKTGSLNYGDINISKGYRP